MNDESTWRDRLRYCWELARNRVATGDRYPFAYRWKRILEILFP